MKLKKTLLGLVLGGLIPFISCASDKINYLKGTSPIYQFDYANLNLEELIKVIETPSQAQDYINYLGCKKIKEGETDDYGFQFNTFKEVLEGAGFSCSEAALIAAAVLEDNGFKPLTLEMWNSYLFGKVGHAVFVYNVNKKFGTIGCGTDDFSRPIYDDIFEITKRYKFEHFRVRNLRKDYGDGFIYGKNLKQK